MNTLQKAFSKVWVLTIVAALITMAGVFYYLVDTYSIFVKTCGDWFSSPYVQHTSCSCLGFATPGAKAYSKRCLGICHSCEDKNVTSNWLIYRNKEYKFQIGYPPNYRLSNEIKTNVAPAIVSQEGDVVISIVVHSNSALLSLRDWLEQNLQNANVSSWKDLWLHPSGVISTPRGNMDGGVDVDVFFLESRIGIIDEFIYHLTFSAKKKDAEREMDIFNLMLGKFKLID